MAFLQECINLVNTWTVPLSVLALMIIIGGYLSHHLGFVGCIICGVLFTLFITASNIAPTFFHA